ncbi:MAG: PAS domain S-box protein [Pseudomonadota bacterium]
MAINQEGLSPMTPSMSREDLTTKVKNLEEQILSGKQLETRLQKEIEERKRTEERLRHEKRNLESLVNHNLLAIVHLDENNSIISCNQAFETLFQYRESELKGLSLDDVVATPAHFNEAFSYSKKTMGGESIHGSGMRLKKDGSLADVEFFGVPVIIDGKVVGAYGLYRDISDLRKAERALRDSELKYRELYEETKKAQDLYQSLIHSSADAVVIYDMSGNAQYISPSFSRIFGWTTEEVMGKRVPFVPESEKETSLAIIRNLIENGTPCHGYETKRYTKDGRILDVSISASRYHHHDGRPAGMLVTLRDISEKKGLEAQLMQAHKMEAIGTLAGGLAHDFNNILQAVSGFTQLLMMDKTQKDPDYSKLQAIEKSAQRARDLTQRLLIFGRKVEAKLRPVDLNHEIEGVCTLLERTIPKMIRIETDLTDRLPVINADPVQLEQIIMNLGVNARDAMSDGGGLIISTKSTRLTEDFCKKNLGSVPGEYVLLSVEDTGCGMHQEILKHIFEPFFTTKETGKGTGLGLAMVYGIVKNHGGYITCESDVGRGTCFKIYFPILGIESESDGTEAIDNEEIPKGNETILLVDDEEAIREIGESLLERFGYKILLADSGEKAVDIYRRKKDAVDLVILDLNMPGMGGYRCLNELTRINSHVKIIIASGYLSDEKLTAATTSGTAAFIGKPFNISALLKKIREMLDKTTSVPTVKNHFSS